MGRLPLPRSRADWLRAAALAAAYLFFGKIGLRLAVINPSATAVWAPTGITLAAFLLYGRRLWPGAMVGAFLTNVLTAGTILTSLGIAAGNTLEGIAGCWLIERFAAGRDAFERPADVFRFAALAPLATAVSATIGTTALSLAGLVATGTVAGVWATWSLGDAAGALTLAPLLVIAGTRPPPRWPARRAVELALLFAVLVATGQTVFGGWLPSWLRVYPLDFVCLPILVWAAYRFGPLETAAASVTLSLLAISGTLRGLGPFARQDPNQSLLLLQLFISVKSILSLAFAAAVLERARAELALRRAYEDLDAQVKQRTDELSKANAELQLFTSVASHDLREPIHKVISFTELISQRAGASMDEIAKDMLDRVRKSALGMSRLVHDLLSLSRVLRDPRPFEAVDLNAAAADAVSDLEWRIKEVGARVDIGTLPSLRAHPTQMRQLLQNLLANALKFHDPARRCVIKVSARFPKDGFVELAVEDNGIGFDARFAERIFQPFVSLHMRGEYAGSGMGLAICRRIAVRHGGIIAARGVPGRGAVFTVTLPYSRAS